MKENALRLQCDKCLKGFAHHENLFVRKNEQNPDLEETGFTCPWCGMEFISIITNSNIRELQERVRLESHRANLKIARGIPVSKAQRRLRQLERSLQSKLNNLNNKG